MGEAKRNLEAVRASYLAELDQWTFPMTDWETRTVAAIRQLETVKVFRRPDHELEYMRMPPRACHANARFIQDNDPLGLSKRVTGWWLQEGNFVLHSVVEQNGNYACVTPAPLHRENPFDFIPDPKIEWCEGTVNWEAYRDGVEIGPGVRSDPIGTLAEMELIRTRLLSGMNPYKAFNVEPATVAAVIV